VTVICSHQKSAPIPVQFLRGPAKVALKAMLLLRIESPSLLQWIPTETLSQDARMLLGFCKSLRSRRFQEPCPDRDSLENDVHVYVRDIVHNLSYGTVLMLALMTWHFDASSSEASHDLVIFLGRPSDIVKRILQGRYQSIMREMAPSDFDFLLVLDSSPIQ
jgi:hypothetical protein